MGNKKGRPGSVSSGTIRAYDLVRAFGLELESLDPAVHEQLFDPPNAPAPVPCEADGDESHAFWASEAADSLLEALEQALNERAPEGHYFGAHPGDGADYGFWPLPDDNVLKLAKLIEARDVSDVRKSSLERAIALGASDGVLAELRDATRVAQNRTILLPLNRLERLSRGKGWARSGRGDTAQWGDREADGYRVGPGFWIVFGTDGFSRKRREEWTVNHVQVGPEVWTIAS
jgi:hypothetical protein